jgi:hypothetical protein
MLFLFMYARTTQCGSRGTSLSVGKFMTPHAAGSLK